MAGSKPRSRRRHRGGDQPEAAGTAVATAGPGKLVSELTTKALCHPRRMAVSDAGLCRSCFTVQMLQTMPDSKDVRKFRSALVDLHKDIEYVKHLGEQAEALMVERLPDYAEMHLIGAQIAASQGDTRPSEWALTRVKPGRKSKPVIADPEKALGPADTGVKVIIGVAMGGVPPADVTARVVDGRVVEQEDSDG